MALINVRTSFTPLSEGKHILRIEDVTYNADFGKLEVKMVNEKGVRHTERFSLMTKTGEPNDKALSAFAFFAKTAMNDFELEEIDHTDLIGHYISVVIEHDVRPSTKNPDETVTFAKITSKEPAEGFSTAPVDTELSLDDLLG